MTSLSLLAGMTVNLQHSSYKHVFTSGVDKSVDPGHKEIILNSEHWFQNSFPSHNKPHPLAWIILILKIPIEIPGDYFRKIIFNSDHGF